MNEPTEAPKSWPYLSQLSVNYLGWSFCWTIATAYLIPNVLLGMVDDSVKNSRLGMMAGVSNIFMLIMIPLIGTLSDRLRLKLGRRRPFYFFASIGVSILILLIVPSRYYIFLFALMLLMHVSYAFWFPNHALIRDIVPLERRGRIAGLTSIASTIGMMVGHAISPSVIASGRMLVLAFVAVVVNIAGNLWVALGIKEQPTHDLPAQKISSWKEIYLPDLEGAKPLGWMAAVNLLTQMGAVAMVCFLLYFIKDQIDSEHFNETFRNVSLIGAGAAIPSAIAAGWIADKLGRKRVLIVACMFQIGSMVNFLLSPWVHSTLYLSGFLFGVGNAAYWSLYWTILSDLVPEGETSKYLGLIQYTSVLPWVIVPPILGTLVDGFGAATGRGYRILFIMVLFVLTAGMLLIRRVPETLNSDSQESTERD
jgi:MFS family permease